MKCNLSPSLYASTITPQFKIFKEFNQEVVVDIVKCKMCIALYVMLVCHAHLEPIAIIAQFSFIAME